MWVAFALGAMIGMLAIAGVALAAEPTNPLQYDRTCNPETEVVVLLEPAEGRGNSVPHACLDWDQVVRP